MICRWCSSFHSSAKCTLRSSAPAGGWQAGAGSYVMPGTRQKHACIDAMPFPHTRLLQWLSVTRQTPMVAGCLAHWHAAVCISQSATYET
jgi:hypothetical protein